VGAVAAELRRVPPALRAQPGARVLEVLQPQDGGVAAHVLQLATALRRRGWEVEVATPATSAIAGPLEAEGVPVHHLPLVREPSPSDLSAIRTLRALDAGRGYALVHAHSSKAGALVRSTLPDRRRLLYTPHCFAFAARFGGPQQLLYRTIEQAVLPRGSAIVAVCDWERRQAERLWGARGLVRQIEYGVEPCAGAAPDPGLLAFGGDRPLAGMVSVLRPQKDPLLAVRAMARLASRGRPPGRLAIVGNGPLEAEVRDEIARLGVGEHVRWFPYGGAVGPYLAALDAFVLPSAWEALPLSLLEAMSCALPIVATGVGGTPEAVEDGVTGRVVPHGDTRALADALWAVLSDSVLREQLGRAGRRAYDARFRVDRMVDETESLYRELLGGAAAPIPVIPVSAGNGRVRVT
jgi:glycosyltransferase involved in cell wall biosynthesis